MAVEGQLAGEGRVIKKFREVVLHFPTIASELGLTLPPVAGRDLRDKSYRGHGDVSVSTTFEGAIRMSSGRWERARGVSLRRRTTTRVCDVDATSRGRSLVLRPAPARHPARGVPANA